MLLQHVDGIQGNHQRRPVGEVDDVQHAVNQGQAQRDEGIHRAGGQPIEQGWEQDAEVKHENTRVFQARNGNSGSASR